MKLVCNRLKLGIRTQTVTEHGIAVSVLILVGLFCSLVSAFAINLKLGKGRYIKVVCI